jgi:hypothetical protein
VYPTFRVPEAHAAEADSRHIHPSAAQLRVLHVTSSTSIRYRRMLSGRGNRGRPSISDLALPYLVLLSKDRDCPMPNLAAIKQESSSSAVRPSQPIEPLGRTVHIQSAKAPKVARHLRPREPFALLSGYRQQVDGSRPADSVASAGGGVLPTPQRSGHRLAGEFTLRNRDTGTPWRWRRPGCADECYTQVRKG